MMKSGKILENIKIYHFEKLSLEQHVLYGPKFQKIRILRTVLFLRILKNWFKEKLYVMIKSIMCVYQRLVKNLLNSLPYKKKKHLQFVFL